MKKTVLASAVLLAMAGAASATPDFGTITIDGKTLKVVQNGHDTQVKMTF